MSKPETVKAILDRIIDVDMLKVTESFMKDEKLKTERKISLISQADTCLHQLRVLRGMTE